MSKLMQEIKIAAREAPRVYFAPLVGAAQEMRRQVRLLSAARIEQKSQQSLQTGSTRHS
jgi:hypothetical protein